MKKLTGGAVLIYVCLLALVGVAAFDDMRRPENIVTDEVVSSFNRDLTRQPGPARPVNRESIDEDVLYRTMNSIHWTTRPARPHSTPEIKQGKALEAE